ARDISRDCAKPAQPSRSWARPLMAETDQAVVQGYLDASAAAQTTTDQGRALEDLICYLFALVPGIAITKRNVMSVFHTEEIDVALWNDPNPEGFNFLPNIILVECKNWS